MFRLSEASVPRADIMIDSMLVRAALDGLLYTVRGRTANPLENLWMIDQALLDPDHPPAQQGRAYELAVVLTDIITTQLTLHRSANALPPPKGAQSRSEAMHQIATDSKTGNIEFIGWSWLYYRYVRIELAISIGDYEDAAVIEPRIRRRYRDHALRRLSQRLIEWEKEARYALRKQRLYARLPVTPPMRLFGRDRDLAALTHTLTHPAVQIVQINGEAGIGKTSLVREATRTLIEADRLAHLVWIDRPSSVADVIDQVRQWIPSLFASEHIHISRSGLIVLDDLSAFTDPLSELERVLMRIAPLQVCLIHPAPLALNNLNLSFRLHLITSADAYALIQWMAFLHPQLALTPDAIAELVQQGNPREIMRFLQADMDE